MKANEVIIDILTQEGMGRPELAHAVGHTPDAIWQRLYNQKKMSVPVLMEMVRALGYKVVIEPVAKNVLDAEGKVVRTRKKYEVTE